MFKYSFFVYLTKTPTLEFKTNDWQSCIKDAKAWKLEGFDGFIKNNETGNIAKFSEILD